MTSYPLIFTDLDGTLLDHETYSWEPALPALRLAKSAAVPVIPCTSKTLSETLTLRAAIGLEGPLIFENGAGVALPQDQFDRPEEAESHHGWWVCRLAKSYMHVRSQLQSLRQSKRYSFRGFGDMSIEEIQELTGLDQTDALNAKRRHHGEPLLWLDTASRFDEFAADIQKAGLVMTRGGRFLHVMGPTNKGKAMVWLAALYQLRNKKPSYLIALGDSDNDIPMLVEADVAVLVRSPVHDWPHWPKVTHSSRTSSPHVTYTRSFGPVGWNLAVLALLEKEHLHG